MKHLILPALTVASLFASGASASDDTARLTVTVHGYSDANAVIELGLFADQTGWDEDRAARDIRVVANGSSVEIVIEDIQPGVYGIKLFHDADNDGELDFNRFGIPQEDYAFSNNARGRFGPARWENARFTVEAGENSHRIELN